MSWQGLNKMENDNLYNRIDEDEDLTDSERREIHQAEMEESSRNGRGDRQAEMEEEIEYRKRHGLLYGDDDGDFY